MFICIQCGASNDVGSNHCGSCGARIPKVDERTALITSTPRTFIKYEALKKEIFKLKSGESTWIDFADWFQGFSEQVTVAIQGIVESINGAQGPGWSYYDEFTEEVETAFSGIESYDTALNQLNDAIDTEDLMLAQAALKKFLQGAEKLNEALALNDENKRKTSAAWGYL